MTNRKTTQKPISKKNHNPKNTESEENSHPLQITRQVAPEEKILKLY